MWCTCPTILTCMQGVDTRQASPGVDTIIRNLILPLDTHECADREYNGRIHLKGELHLFYTSKCVSRCSALLQRALVESEDYNFESITATNITHPL